MLFAATFCTTSGSTLFKGTFPVQHECACNATELWFGEEPVMEGVSSCCASGTGQLTDMGVCGIAALAAL